MFKKLSRCHNTNDFRDLAKQRIPSPIFHYIDGGADDEITLSQNTKAFEKCDLIPNVLKGVGEIDTSVSVMGQNLKLVKFWCLPEKIIFFALTKEINIAIHYVNV